MSVRTSKGRFELDHVHHVERLLAASDEALRGWLPLAQVAVILTALIRQVGPSRTSSKP
jgi:hypothetical protein